MWIGSSIRLLYYLSRRGIFYFLFMLSPWVQPLLPNTHFLLHLFHFLKALSNMHTSGWGAVHTFSLFFASWYSGFIRYYYFFFVFLPCRGGHASRLRLFSFFCEYAAEASQADYVLYNHANASMYSSMYVALRFNSGKVAVWWCRHRMSHEVAGAVRSIQSCYKFCLTNINSQT